QQSILVRLDGALRPLVRGKPGTCAAKSRSWTIRDRGPQPLANSNFGNGNLRPETLGAPRREKFSQRAKPTAETGAPRAGYGNVALFLTLGSHVGLRGLPRKPVCGGRRGKS